MNARCTALLLAIAGFAVAAVAGAATLTVDCNAGEKIQERVVAARPVDTILVSGTCNENVAITSEIVRITLDGQGKTVIQKNSGHFPVFLGA